MSSVVGCGAGVSGTGADSGSISVALTDAPIDEAASVVVQFSAVKVRGAGTGQNLDFTFDTPKSIDLISLRGLKTESLLSNESLPAGTYNEIRLVVDAVDGQTDSFIVLQQGGAQHQLTVPSGAETGLKLKGDFTIEAGQNTNFTVDFDVRQSIVKSGNPTDPRYHLKPVLRVVENSEVGHVIGTVSAALLDDASCSDADPDTGNAVYVFTGAGITPDDIDGDAVEPVTTTLLEYDAIDDLYRYEAAFLPAGEYTVSFTCNADVENVEADDELQFTGTQDVVVSAGQSAVVDF